MTAPTEHRGSRRATRDSGPDRPTPGGEEVDTATCLTDLVESWAEGGGFLFSSPRGGLLAQGGTAVSTGHPPAGLPAPAGVPAGLGPNGRSGGQPAALLVERVRQALVGAAALRRRPVLVGAVPFDLRSPAWLTVPDTILRTAPQPAARPGARQTAADPAVGAFGPAAAGEVRKVREDPPRHEYEQSVRLALDRIAAGELDKVVLARSVRLALRSPCDLRQVLRRLASGDPLGHVFAVEPARGPADPVRRPPTRALVGASPELLVSRYGRTVVSAPLAGSAPRAADPAEDHRRASALLASTKDRREHEFVADAVAKALAPFCVSVARPREPTLLSTATMWHLCTPVRGTLAEPAADALTLALALHPTPAVCGSPPAAARRTIDDLEPFDRGLYAGLVGWTDSTGDGEWAVTIRCALVDQSEVVLHAGAGIVAGSTPGGELAETSAKFGTLSAALGLGARLGTGGDRVGTPPAATTATC